LAGDANHDGVASSSGDEFIELVNRSGVSVSLDGWRLETGQGTLTVRHVFRPGTVLAPGSAVVVFGGGTPTGSFGNSLVTVASSGNLALINAPTFAESIALLDSTLLTVDQVLYIQSTPNVSYVRDVSGQLVLQSSLPGAIGGFTPGFEFNGASFAPAVPEPSAYAALLTGIILLGIKGRFGAKRTPNATEPNGAS
jgi:hypothetical protein